MERNKINNEVVEKILAKADRSWQGCLAAIWSGTDIAKGIAGMMRTAEVTIKLFINAMPELAPEIMKAYVENSYSKQKNKAKRR